MSEIRYLIVIALAVGCATSFIIQLIGKLGVRDWAIERSPRLISELLGCDYCLSFWISAIFAVSVSLATQWPEALMIPVISTPIARFLL